MASALSGALGKRVDYIDVSPDGHHSNLVKAGMSVAYADAEISLDAALAEGFGSAVSDAVPNILGRTARDFEHFAADHAGDFR